MFNSKMIGANAPGTAPQPPGSGALLYTSGASDGTGGLWISTDDGVSWSQNAFTGIDATDNTKWNTEIRWFGSNFVMRENGTRDFWSSTDGYNWSYAFTITPPYLDGPGVDINATAFTNMFADGNNGNGYIGCYFNNQYYSNRRYMHFYKTTDGGATFSLAISHNNNSTSNQLRHMSVWNNYFMGNSGVGSLFSNDGGSSWSNLYDGTSRTTNVKTWGQNGTFSTFGPRFETGYATSSAIPVVSQTSWTRVTGLTSSQTSFARITGDGISKVAGVAQGGEFLYSTNNGQSYSKMTTTVQYQNIGYHNGYFFYTNGGNLYKTNDFSTEILLGSDPSTSRALFSSMSDMV